MECIWNLSLFMLLFYHHMISITIGEPTSSPFTPTQTPIIMMHYFLPGNVLPFNDSIQFCQHICNSDLASIHSADQLTYGTNSLDVRPQTIWAPNGNEGNDAYIGLTSADFPSAPLLWSDDTPFNCGNDTNLGTVPWKENHPKGYQSTCVILEANSSRWRDIECDYNVADRFLCNDCNGNIHKYALVTTNETVATYNRSNAICKSIYGTSLASIHTDRDQLEIMTLLRISGDDTAWIGLKYIASNYFWQDGTSFNYGVNHTLCPPNNCAADSCVVINHQNQTWQHTACTNSYVHICNLPSELSFDLNTWTQLEGNWSYDADVMEIRHPIIPDTTYGPEFVILNKQWFNGNDPLRIELGFTIDEYNTGNEGWFGITIYNGETASDCDNYWVGLNLLAHNLCTVEIWQYVGAPSYDARIAQSDTITFSTLPFFGTFSIIITNGNFFEVWLNNEQYLSYVHRNPSFNVLSNGYSGYISLYSGIEVKTRTQYLYISGTPETVSPLKVYSPESLCWELTQPNTIVPTAAPTDNIIVPTTAISGETLIFYDSMDDYALNWNDGDSKCYQWSTFYDTSSGYTSATELCSADTYRCCLITVHLSDNSKAGYIERTIHQLEEYNAFYIEYDLYIRDNMVTSNDAPPAYAILEYNFTSDTDYIQLEALKYINNGINVFRPKPTPIFYNNNADSSLTLRFRNNGTTFNYWQEYSVDNVYLYGFLPTLAPIISPILSPTLYPSAASNSTFSPSRDSTNNPLKSTFVASITTTRNRTKSSSSSQNSTNTAPTDNIIVPTNDPIDIYTSNAKAMDPTDDVIVPTNDPMESNTDEPSVRLDDASVRENVNTTNDENDDETDNPQSKRASNLYLYIRIASAFVSIMIVLAVIYCVCLCYKKREKTNKDEQNMIEREEKKEASPKANVVELEKVNSMTVCEDNGAEEVDADCENDENNVDDKTPAGNRDEDEASVFNNSGEGQTDSDSDYESMYDNQQNKPGFETATGGHETTTGGHETTTGGHETTTGELI